MRWPKKNPVTLKKLLEIMEYTKKFIIDPATITTQEQADRMNEEEARRKKIGLCTTKWRVGDRYYVWMVPDDRTPTLPDIDGYALKPEYKTP